MNTQSSGADDQPKKMGKQKNLFNWTACSLSGISLLVLHPQTRAVIHARLYEMIRKTYSFAKNILPTLHQFKPLRFVLGRGGMSTCPHGDCNKKSSLPVQLKPIEVHSDMVTRILGCNPGNFTLHGTNTYLVGSGSTRILIDTGEGKSEYICLLKEAMERVGCNKIGAILITHRHYDHLGGIHSIYEEFGKIPTYKCMRDKAHFGEELNEEHWKDYQYNAHIPSDIDWQHISEHQQFEVSGSSSSAAATGVGGDRHDSKAVLTAIYTPGHCEDHVCFLLESSSANNDTKQAALFAGDNVLGLGTSWFENLSDYVSSLKLMLKICKQGGLSKGTTTTTAPNGVASMIDVLYTGHGPIVEKGAVAKLEEYITHREQREQQVDPPPPLSLSLSLSIICLFFVFTPIHYAQVVEVLLKTTRSLTSLQVSKNVKNM
jgi:endoribonuclease LACTB2